MTETLVIEHSNEFKEMKWSPMVLVSFIFHLFVFSMILFVPEPFPSRPIDGIIYNVDLVEMPASRDLQVKGTGASKGKKAKTVVQKDSQARRITSIKKEKKPLIIAKRTVKKKTSTIKKSKGSSSQMIDRAISKIKSKVLSENRSHINRAISKLENKYSGREGLGIAGGASGGGIPIRIYQAEVEERIKGNWSYPVALESLKNLEAVVVVMVKKDGTISQTRFIKKSPSPIFNQSVLRAVERSDPLPPFPEGYRKSFDEIEINFNLKELEK
ncbi:MAG: energy transducer TonB [Thermodesulfobacteriota bacterium]|nr:energy transducer TonB [Thermodesulfobacteriota bacterium]